MRTFEHRVPTGTRTVFLVDIHVEVSPELFEKQYVDRWY